MRISQEQSPLLSIGVSKTTSCRAINPHDYKFFADLEPDIHFLLDPGSASKLLNPKNESVRIWRAPGVWGPKRSKTGTNSGLH